MEDLSTLRVEVEPGPASDDGLSLRFKAIDAPVALRRVAYEDDDGVGGLWDVAAVDDAAGEHPRAAMTALVEDSSDGTARLVAGGAHGLLLTHRASGARRREPYLLLASSVVFER